MARYGVPSSSDSSGEDEISSDMAKLYCKALTELTPDIVPLLQNEIKTILAKCYSKGLIGEDMYHRGLTLHGNSHQANQLLLVVAAQVKIKPSFCHTFLKILRSMAAIDHIANRIEMEVSRLQKQQVKRKGGKKNPGHRSCAGMPKLDLHEEGYSSGFQSESSTKVAGDSGPSPNASHATHHPPMQSASYDAGVETPESHGGELHEITTTPYLHFTGSSEIGEETVEENRSLQDTEKICSSVAESVQYMRSDSSKSEFVYPSRQSNIIEGYDNIGRVVEKEKQKAQSAFMDKDNTILQLQQQLKVKEEEQYQERKKHEEEMKEKERELLRCSVDIEQRSQEIQSLKKAHEQQMKALEKEHMAKVKKITKELEEKSQLAQQKMERDLKRARDEKVSLEKQKSEAELEIAELKMKHQNSLQEEKKKYESEIKKLELSYNSEIHKLEEVVEKEKNNAKQKEDFINMSHKNNLLQLEIKYKDEIAALKENINELKQGKTEADAQARICEAIMETHKEREAKEKAAMQAQMDAKEAEIRIHKAESDKNLALREQAQEHDKEKKEMLLNFCAAQRAVSSSSGASNSFSEESLTVSLLQMSLTRTSGSNSQSDGSRQQTPGEECEDHPFNEDSQT